MKLPLNETPDSRLTQERRADRQAVASNYHNAVCGVEELPAWIDWLLDLLQPVVCTVL